jgi:hypothetical protein
MLCGNPDMVKDRDRRARRSGGCASTGAAPRPDHRGNLLVAMARVPAPVLRTGLGSCSNGSFRLQQRRHVPALASQQVPWTWRVRRARSWTGISRVPCLAPGESRCRSTCKLVERARPPGSPRSLAGRPRLGLRFDPDAGAAGGTRRRGGRLPICSIADPGADRVSGAKVRRRQPEIRPGFPRGQRGRAPPPARQAKR